MRRDAADRTRRDERGIVVERDEHIGRSGRDRKSGDDGADGRAGALRHHRGSDDEAGGNGHLQSEREPEEKVGGHIDGSVRTPSWPGLSRPSTS